MLGGGGLSKKEKGLMNMDKSMVLAEGREYNRKNTIKIKLRKHRKDHVVAVTSQIHHKYISVIKCCESNYIVIAFKAKPL